MAALKKRPKKVEALKWASKGKCFYCGQFMGSKATWDHFLPVFRGHSHRLNIVLACKKCNCRKGHRRPSPKQKEKFAYFTHAYIAHRLSTLSGMEQPKDIA